MMPVFLSPYFYLGVALSAIAGFGYGTYLGAERLESFTEQVESTGRAQAAVTSWIGKRQESITKGVNDVQKRKEAALQLSITNLRSQLHDARTRRSVVPDIPIASGSSEGVGAGGDSVCYAGGKLRGGVEAAISAAEQRAAELIFRGATAIARFETCAKWAIDQQTLGGNTSTK